MPVSKADVKSPAFSDAETVNTGRTAPGAEPVKQDKPVAKSSEDDKPQSYVHLADGSVLRVFNEDLPGSSGAQNPFGHWQRENKVFEVIGIYPVESVVEDN